MFSLVARVFLMELSTGVSLGKAHYPRAVLDLVLGVKSFVVGGSGLPHLPEDFEPALGQASQGTGMAHAALAFVLIIRLSPGTFFAAEIYPEMHGATQVLIAPGAEVHPPFFAGLFGHRCRAGIALDCLGILKSSTIVAKFR